MTETLDDVRATFAFFDTWEDRYRYIIDLGKALEQLPLEHRIDPNLVRGCQSRVWLVPNYDVEADRLRLAIDSDAHIVRGLIAIVLAAYDGKSPTAVLAFDIENLFDELQLINHLSPTRGNGLRAMVRKIRAVAGDYARSFEEKQCAKGVYSSATCGTLRKEGETTG